MSRNARNNENDRLDEISSKRVNFQGFDDFGQFLVNFVKAEISSADLTILTNIRHFRYCMQFWTYLTYDLYSKCLF